jgi:hypothetical protein
MAKTAIRYFLGHWQGGGSNINLTGKQAVMAGRILNRRELRKQTDQAEQAEAGVLDPAATVSAPKAAARRKASATPKVRKPRKPKASPRMRALWCVYDGGMKEVALFDYNQRAAAEQKLATLLGKQKGTYFLQIVKQPMSTGEPAETSSVA